MKLFYCNPIFTVIVGGTLMLSQPLRSFQETRTRDLILKTFRNERPSGPQKAAHDSGSSKGSAKGASIVGVTLWRMRPSASSDPVKVRGLVHDPGEADDTKEWTAERVSMESPLTAGQFVRLSIESARPGYLYVINRDVYSDGTSSAPNLIFPTLRLRGGDNRVQPGVAIEIPDGEDRPPVFRLKKTRADQVSSMVTVIVAPQPLAEIRPSRDAQRLSTEQVAAWEKKWGSKVERVDDATSLGKVYTPAEQRAAQPNPEPLGRTDPIPVTLIKAETHAGQPMLISVPIKME